MAVSYTHLKNVKISNLNFQVVGIYKDDESRNNTEAFIAYSTIKTIYAKGDDAGSCLLYTSRINSKGLYTSCVMGFCNTLNEILTKEKPTHIAVAFDHGKTCLLYTSPSRNG